MGSSTRSPIRGEPCSRHSTSTALPPIPVSAMSCRRPNPEPPGRMDAFVGPRPKLHQRRWWRLLGPGLITGAADDDPSGIATYAQAGTQFGFGLSWTLLLT